ncbi:hypothetical protein ACFWOG_12030 [Kitasatospora sp. NPDC058406]|uniref:hypothetical protein n=1 Tax=Kitasatospora sp. NPDC058406 TaxID=3346483 RepID=UPI0036612A07
MRRPTTTTVRTASATALCLLAALVTAAPVTAAPSVTPPAVTDARETGGTDETGGTGGTGRPTVRVRGGGGATLTKDFSGMEGDLVRFEVDARTDLNNAPGHARGRFHVTHHRPDGALVADFEGTLDCLAAGGRTAITTGVVTGGSAPWFPDLTLVGSRVSLTVQDDGRNDRLGWLWGAFGIPVSDCQGTVPFIRTDTGNFTVRG